MEELQSDELENFIELLYSLGVQRPIKLSNEFKHIPRMSRVIETENGFSSTSLERLMSVSGVNNYDTECLEELARVINIELYDILRGACIQSSGMISTEHVERTIKFIGHDK